MAEEKGPIPTVLSVLLELLADSEVGFRKLATGLRADEAVLMCLEESVVRTGYHGELQEALQRTWREVPAGGTLAGRLHRGWLDLKITLGFSDRELLSTAQTCEMTTILGYKAALEHEELPADLSAMLEHQRKHVEAVHVHLKSLEERLAS